MEKDPYLLMVQQMPWKESNKSNKNFLHVQPAHLGKSNKANVHRDKIQTVLSSTSNELLTDSRNTT